MCVHESERSKERGRERDPYPQSNWDPLCILQAKINIPFIPLSYETTEFPQLTACPKHQSLFDSLIYSMYVFNTQITVKVLTHTTGIQC